MKRKLFSVVLTALIVPLIVSGQTETYKVSVVDFSSKKYDEFSPVYYGKGLVFCSNRTHSLISNYLTSENKGLFKINYIESINPYTTGKGDLLSKDLSTRFNDGPASFNKNGDTIYFSRNLKVDGPISDNSNPRNKLGIFTAVLEDGKWVKVTDLRFNNEYYNITTPSMSPDGKRLFFASDNPAGHGGSDLYYCEWKGDFWEEPVNMGSLINTTGNESYPFADGEGALYFSSDGLPGLGGKDIFYTKQSVTGEWQAPVHIDTPVNSKYDDFALIADSMMNEGYFSSKRGKSIDIYHFKTNIYQLFYCGNEKVNQFCFKFTDEGKIPIDERYVRLEWDFGDGSKATGTNVEHCFPGPGRYAVRLNVVDIITGTVFFSKLSYNLELRDIEQPLITASASGMAGQAMSFDGLSSHFPGSEVLNYTWYFGDGDRTVGEKVAHTYPQKGDYEVRLGLKVRNTSTGVIHSECVSQLVRVFGSQGEKNAFDNKVVPPQTVKNILDYDQAEIENMYSVEKGFSQDVVFQIEALNSKTKLSADNKVFANLPPKFRIREIFRPEEKVYSYIIGEEITLMETFLAFREIKSLGYNNARVVAWLPEDQATRDLNNLKRVFGVKVDEFFRKNDFRLSSAGTQLLDQILGFTVKYPDIRLEITSHTDNIGTSSANQDLSQRRAEAMVSYLVSNGVNSSRLVARGYGESKPVASNILEADRKLNRRIDFAILK